MPRSLMLLGGIRYLIPVIKAARERGYRVITADYLPGNIAHAYSDEYVNVSITDREAVLEAARRCRIDGIMSFGVDPGVVSAAYVQEKLGLPSFGPLRSVEILQNKDAFRDFLTRNGFNVPRHASFSSPDEALSACGSFRYPVIVKPTDSAGSKGVSRVDGPEALLAALREAFAHSLKGRVIVEEFIERAGFSSDSDSFSVDGRLSVVNFNAQRFDADAPNPYVPSAYTWPSGFTPAQESAFAADIQRLLNLLEMKTSLYNIEVRMGTDGLPYLMELTPRGGGNRLSELIRLSTGADMITAVTRYVVGDGFEVPCARQPEGYWAEIILHSPVAGRFCSLWLHPDLRPYLVEEDLWVRPGDAVRAFKGANDTIGTLILHFPERKLMEEVVAHQDAWIHIKTENQS